MQASLFLYLRGNLPVLTALREQIFCKSNEMEMLLIIERKEWQKTENFHSTSQ